MESSVIMDEELRKAIADYFDPGNLVEFLGLTTDQILEEFNDEVEDALEDIKELMGLRLPHLNPDEDEGDEE